MDVRQLRAFLAVVDYGGVRRAADHLFVAQPSLTQTIRRLEAELGTELFIRKGRGLVLSPSGEALVDPARAVVRARDVARETVAAVDGLRGGRLRIVSMPSQAISPLTGLIAAFAARYPLVDVAVAAADRPDDVRDALHRGVAEIGVLASPRMARDAAGLHRVPLESQSFVLMARDDAALPPGAGPLALGELRGLRLIAGQPGTGMRRVADAIVAAAEDCRIAVEVEHREGLLPLVLSGVGAAVVADSWRPLADAVGLRVRRLSVEDRLDVALVWPHQQLSPAAAAFADSAGPGGTAPQRGSAR
ncbi:LysR family transcriptional regulator [Nocardiopsis coralliicola]